MKIIVGSYTNFDGLGHSTRILHILNVLNQLYGSDNIEWINVFPGGRQLFSSFNQSKKKYKSNKYKVTFIPFLSLQITTSIPVVDYILKWMSGIYVFLYLLIKYGKRKDLILWIEMTSSAWPFQIYKSLFHVPLILDVHGTIDEKIQYKNSSQQAIINYAMGVYDEMMAISNSDVFVGVSNRMIEIFRSRYKFIPAYSYVLPIFTSDEYKNFSESTRTIIRRELGINESFVFVYSGGIQPWQCLPDTLFFFKKIVESDIFKPKNPVLLLLIWNKQNKLIDMIEEIGLPMERVKVMSVPQNEVANYLSAADVGILFRENLTTNLVSSPTKAGEYLNAGLPILCTPYVGDISSLVQKENVGFLIDIWRDVDFVKLLNWCSDICQNRKEYNQRCMEVGSQLFSNKNIDCKVEEIIDQVLALQGNSNQSN
jgi:glycosyltransferase involved in cell wall biosynthesis